MVLSGIVITYTYQFFIKKDFNFNNSTFGITVTGSSFSCNSITLASLYSEPDFSNTSGSNIKTIGALNKGTDTIAVQVEGDKAYFLTGASQKAGVAKPDESWDVIKNTNDELFISWINENTSVVYSGIMVNNFIINKKNGLAIWSRLNDQGLLSDNPEGIVHYFSCH